MITDRNINLLKQKIAEADAIVIGGASGMSASSGFKFYYQRDEVFGMIAGSLEDKYGFHSFFDALYDRRPTRGEHWAMLIRTMKYIYDSYTGDSYSDLAELLKDKNYYVATTNQDAQFYRVFPKEKITPIQGDWRYWQCSRPCHDEVYYNRKNVYDLYENIKDDSLPDDLIPRCKYCGHEMAPWVRSHTFLEGKFYKSEMNRYKEFLRKNMNGKTLFLELGVGMMTPMFIKEPFMNMVYRWPKATYVTINPQHVIIPKEISDKSLGIKDDIAITLKRLLGKSTEGMSIYDKNNIFNPSRVY